MSEHPGRRTRLGAYVCPVVLERVRQAAYWTPGMTVSSLVEEALAREVDRLEEERGRPFLPRPPGRLSTGRLGSQPPE